MTGLAPLFGAVALILLGGVFAAIDASISTVSMARVDELVRDERPGAARLARLMGDRPRVINLVVLLRITCETIATVLLVAYLVEDLGLDPSPELQRLEAQILAHDPTLSVDKGSDPFRLAPTSEPIPPLPAPATPLLGREEDLEVAVAAALAQNGIELTGFHLGTPDLGRTGEVIQATLRARLELERERAEAATRLARAVNDAELDARLPAATVGAWRYRETDLWGELIQRTQALQVAARPPGPGEVGIVTSDRAEPVPTEPAPNVQP